MKDNLIGFPKYVAGFILTFVFRLLSPYMGTWNISPLMATELAGAKAYGPLSGGIYGTLSMILVDLSMNKIGSWTIMTAVCYGAVGFFGGYYLSKREASVWNFVIVSIAGTLFFDAITGVIAGPLIWGGSFYSAFIGQIPFTIRHLSGNILFAIVLSPWFYKSIMKNTALNVSFNNVYINFL